MSDLIIEKIRKLLALADERGGGTEAERALAAEKAQQLMFQHHLDQAALDNYVSPQDIAEHVEEVKGVNNQWRGVLLFRIGLACGCDGYVVELSRSHSFQHEVGRRENLDLALAIYHSLVPWLEAEAARSYKLALKRYAADREGLLAEHYDEEEIIEEIGKPIKPKSFRRAFFDSASARISGRLAAKRRDMEAKGGETGTALVRSEEAANRAFLQKQGITLREGKAKDYHSMAGRMHGSDAGNRASLAAGTVTAATRGELGSGS